MKPTFRRLLLFMIPLIVLIAGSSIVSKAVLKNGNFFRLKPDTQYLILGHSQTECGIDDSQIANAQNFSQGGEAYFYTWQKLQKLIAVNPQVKTVFISYANNQIHKRMDKWIWGNENMYANYGKYAFMMDGSDYRVLLSHNFQEVLKSETKGIKDFMLFMIKNRHDYLGDRNWGGYLYTDRHKVDSLLKTDYLQKERKDIKPELSPTNIAYLEKIVNFCNEKHIRIIFMRMPVRPDLPFLQNESQYQGIRQTKFREVEYLDFKNYPAKPKEVGDFEHLNHKGAKSFSQFFDGLLKSGLLKSKDMQADIDAAMAKLTVNDSAK